MCGSSPDGSGSDSEGSLSSSTSSNYSDQDANTSDILAGDGSPVPMGRSILYAHTRSASGSSAVSETASMSSCDEEGQQHSALLPVRESSPELEHLAAPNSQARGFSELSSDLAQSKMAAIRALASRDNLVAQADYPLRLPSISLPGEDQSLASSGEYDGLPLESFSPQSVSSNLLSVVSTPNLCQSQLGLAGSSEHSMEEMQVIFRDAVADTIEAIFASSSVTATAAEAAFLSQTSHPDMFFGNLQAGLHSPLLSQSSICDRSLDCRLDGIRSGDPTGTIGNRDPSGSGSDKDDHKSGKLAGRRASWAPSKTQTMQRAAVVSTAPSPIQWPGTMLATSAAVGICSLAALLRNFQLEAVSGVPGGITEAVIELR